jgi:hypothetical protein
MLKATPVKRSALKAAPKVAKTQRKALKATKKAPLRKLTKRSLSTAATTDVAPAGDKVGLPMAYPLAPFSSPEQIRNAVDHYKQSLALSDAESPFQGLGQIIKSHGKLPFAAFLMTALASKEIYMIDPGLLVSFNTTVVIFSYYALAYDGVKTSFNEYVDSINSKYQDGLKTASAVYEAGIKHCQSALDKPSIIADANQAFQEAHDAVTEARVRVAEQKHKDVIVNKLNTILAAEQAEAKAQADQVRSEAMGFLKANAFSDKVKADVMDEALALVGKKTGDSVQFKSLQSVLKASIEHGNKSKK